MGLKTHTRSLFGYFRTIKIRYARFALPVIVFLFTLTVAVWTWGGYRDFRRILESMEAATPIPTPLFVARILPVTPTPSHTPTITPTPSPTPRPSLTPAPLRQGSSPISLENASSLSLIGRLGQGTVQDLLFSQDGHTLAVATANEVFFYDVESLTEIGYLDFQGQRWQDIVFSPDGLQVAISFCNSEEATDLIAPCAGGDVQIWDYVDSRITWQQSFRTSIDELAFSSSNRLLAVSQCAESETRSEIQICITGGIEIWDTSTSDLLGAVEGLEGQPRYLTFSPDGNYLAGAVGSGTVRVWNATDYTPLRIFEGHEGDVLGLAFLDDSSTLASWSSFKDVKFWGVEDGLELYTLPLLGIPGALIDLDISADGSLVAATGLDDNLIHVWEANDEDSRRELPGHLKRVNKIAFSPNRRTLVSASEDGTIQFWRIPDGISYHTLQNFSNHIGSVLFSNNGDLLAVSEREGQVRVWDLSNRRLEKIIPVSVCGRGGISISEDDQSLAALNCEQDRSGSLVDLQVWSLVEKDEYNSVPMGRRFASEPTDISFSLDWRTIALSSWNFRPLLWRVSDLSRSYEVRGHLERAYTVAFSPSGRTFATGTFNGKVHLWQTSSIGRIRTLEGHTGGVLALAFSPDERLIASAGEDRIVRIWNTNGALLQALEGHLDEVQSLAFSPDGTILASADGHGDIRLWDVANGVAVSSIQGHVGSVTSLAFSLDETLLASGSEDGTLHLWGVQ